MYVGKNRIAADLKALHKGSYGCGLAGERDAQKRQRLAFLGVEVAASGGFVQVAQPVPLNAADLDALPFNREAAKLRGGEPCIDGGDVVVDGASGDSEFPHYVLKRKAASNGLGQSLEQLCLTALEFHFAHLPAQPQLMELLLRGTISTSICWLILSVRKAKVGLTNLVQGSTRWLCKDMC